MKINPAYIFLVVVFTIHYSCSIKPGASGITSLFTLIDSSQSGITFENNLIYDPEIHKNLHRNFYNGGGVAIGDIDNDSLPDIYFTAQMGKNKLYRNKGNFVFEDISAIAGVEGTQTWSTGVSMADVNGDGLLDIYVCNSGDIKGENKENELFINQGNLTFKEMAEEYGLHDRGYSTHAAFFDYDRDGDLDMYLLNNSYQAIDSNNFHDNIRNIRDSLGGDKLFRNEGLRFTDVSEQAGIYGSLIGFGLGITVGDIDKDGWQDIYVCNDFFERDYLYINLKDGTFKEVLPEQMPSISAASMGVDLADINDDGYPDLFVTDRLPSSEKRLKTKTTFEDWNEYQYLVKNGYHHQFTRNMLQLNHGDGSFSEIGRLSGVHATDWSWGSLIFDMDLDGKKDIFVTNGIYKDLTDLDYLNLISDKNNIRNIFNRDTVDYNQSIDSIPCEAIPNHAFHNEGNFMFSDKAKHWGFATPSFSNGAAYGDLDLDGDPDLVVNNVNMPCFLYRNEAVNQLGHHYLKVRINGKDKNSFAFGTQLSLYAGGQMQYLEHLPIRGYKSSMEPLSLFGLGKTNIIDSLIAVFPDQKQIKLFNIQADQTLLLNQSDASILPIQIIPADIKPLFEIFPVNGLRFVHQENEYSDFDRDRLIYHMRSTEGPKISIGDFNGDQQADFFIGNAKGALKATYMQTLGGTLVHVTQPAFERSRECEDMGSALADFDGDGDLDLYVCSGGSEDDETSPNLMDRLYLNGDRGHFKSSGQNLPTTKLEPTSCVRASDFDQDGDIDLFVGVRAKPFYYGVPVNGYLLVNDGKGQFTEQTKALAPGLIAMGMITDARWSDIDGDAQPDLIVCGEFMPIRIFKNSKGHLAPFGQAGKKGWWNCLLDVDLDGDGDLDLIAGNHGLNSRFKAQPGHPLKMFVNDFDQNGTVEQILTSYREGRDYPFAMKHDLISQMPVLQKKYAQYKTFAGKVLSDFFPQDQQTTTLIDSISTLETSIYLNNGKGQFTLKTLPIEAQFSPVYAICSDDFNGDGLNDLFLGGNLYGTKPEAGRYDASYGLVLTQQKDGSFKTLSAAESGIRIQGEIRDIQPIVLGGKKSLIIARNNDIPLIYSYP